MFRLPILSHQNPGDLVLGRQSKLPFSPLLQLGQQRVYLCQDRRFVLVFRYDGLLRAAATQRADARSYIIALEHTIDAVCNAEARVHQVLAHRFQVCDGRSVAYRVYCVPMPQLVR